MSRRLVLAATFLTACTSPPEVPEAVGKIERALDTTNGTSLNGTSLNGTSLNGTSLNGTSLNGTSLNGTSLNGTSLNGTSLNGCQLQGWTAKGARISGAAMTGAIFNGTTSNGATVRIKIAAVRAVAPDLYFYSFEYQGAPGGAWSPLCGVEADNSEREAIALPGTWNYKMGTPGGGSWSPSTTNFTIGCRHASFAKCVEMGYHPWSEDDGQSVQPYHQACVRTLRADYCGNGISYTTNGQLIDLYDALGIQTDTEPSWLPEAEWSDAGALCMNTQRVFSLQQSGVNLPQCVLDRQQIGCGMNPGFRPGTLLIDKYPLPAVKVF